MKKYLLLFLLAIVTVACEENDLKPKTSNKPSNQAKTEPTEVVSEAEPIEPISEIEPAENASEAEPAENASEAEPAETLPETAIIMDIYDQHSLFINNEGLYDDYMEYYIWSVWLVDERTNTACKLFTSNPKAEAPWELMSEIESNAVEVPLDMIAVPIDMFTEKKAYFFPGDVTKVVVEGCPDSRNIWTYVIDTRTRTAKQFPSTEGLVEADWENKEIILGSYGYYEEGGRYGYKCAYDADGKFLRRVGDIMPY